MTQLLNVVCSKSKKEKNPELLCLASLSGSIDLQPIQFHLLNDSPHIVLFLKNTCQLTVLFKVVEATSHLPPRKKKNEPENT